MVEAVWSASVRMAQARPTFVQPRHTEHRTRPNGPSRRDEMRHKYSLFFSWRR